MARIYLVRNGFWTDTGALGHTWAQVANWFAGTSQSRTWTTDVLNVIVRLPQRFSLTQVYAARGELERLHPRNRHVRAKIRQQLQRLRDMGVLRFTAPGQYERIIPPAA
jgi:type II restriction enzyme